MGEEGFGVVACEIGDFLYRGGCFKFYEAVDVDGCEDTEAIFFGGSGSCFCRIEFEMS